MKETEIVRSLPSWFNANARDLPWRRSRDPYAVWVSEVMLQQTQVKTVIPYWNRWMRALPDIVSLAKIDPEKLHKLWEGLGYYTRARNLQKAARLIVERSGGKFPTDFDAVLELPGIGRYTAGAICSIAFNEPRPILDGNVMRVLARLFGIAGNVREKQTNQRLWELSERLVRRASAVKPRGSPSLFNQSLMELGALVCTPRQPRCLECPVTKLCFAREKGRIATLPNLGPRVRATQRRLAAFLVRESGRFLVRQRPAGAVNAHLWEFPNLELAGLDEAPKNTAQRLFGIAPERVIALGTIKHSITCNRITLEVFAVEGIIGPAAALGGQWRTPQEMDRLPFPAAHKRIRQRFAGVGQAGALTPPANLRNQTGRCSPG